MGGVLYKAIEVDIDTDGDGLADKAEAFYETNASMKTPMVTVTSTERKLHSVVTQPTPIRLATGPPPISMPPPPWVFWKTCLLGNSWLISTQPIPRPTPPLLLPR